jgi:hypothetical protein
LNGFELQSAANNVHPTIAIKIAHVACNSTERDHSATPALVSSETLAPLLESKIVAGAVPI